MKKFLLTVSLAILGITSLPLSTFAGERIDALSTSDSGCHRGRDTRSDEDDDYGNYTWDISYNDGILSITWFNVWASCCLLESNGWLELEDNNHLTYDFTLIDDMCDCMCVYDLTSTFENIKPGHYTITFHIYNEDFTAEIDLEEGCNIRLEKSPAGIHSLTLESDMMSLSANGILHIDAPGKLVVEIYNAAGAIQTRINAADRADIDITSLRKGIYIAKLISGDGSSTLRFIR